MDLHAVVSPCIGAVNPMVAATLYQSTGYVTERGGTRRPTYSVQTGQIQRQGISERTLAHLNNLGIGGVMRRVYLHGEWASVIRTAQKGGDLLAFDDQLWLAVHVLEQWPDWCAIAVVLQKDPIVLNHVITASTGGNGSIAPSGNVVVFDGDNQTFVITPNTGYAVEDVLVDGASVGAVSSYTFTDINSSSTISASFLVVEPYYTITTPATGAVNFNADGTQADPNPFTLQVQIHRFKGHVSPITLFLCAHQPTESWELQSSNGSASWITGSELFPYTGYQIDNITEDIITLSMSGSRADWENQIYFGQGTQVSGVDENLVYVDGNNFVLTPVNLDFELVVRYPIEGFVWLDISEEYLDGYVTYSPGVTITYTVEDQYGNRTGPNTATAFPDPFGEINLDGTWQWPASGVGYSGSITATLIAEDGINTRTVIVHGSAQ